MRYGFRFVFGSFCLEYREGGDWVFVFKVILVWGGEIGMEEIGFSLVLTFRWKLG